MLYQPTSPSAPVSREDLAQLLALQAMQSQDAQGVNPGSGADGVTGLAGIGATTGASVTGTHDGFGGNSNGAFGSGAPSPSPGSTQGVPGALSETGALTTANASMMSDDSTGWDTSAGRESINPMSDDAANSPAPSQGRAGAAFGSGAFSNTGNVTPEALAESVAGRGYAGSPGLPSSASLFGGSYGAPAISSPSPGNFGFTAQAPGPTMAITVTPTATFADRWAGIPTDDDAMSGRNTPGWGAPNQFATPAPPSAPPPGGRAPIASTPTPGDPDPSGGATPGYGGGGDAVTGGYTSGPDATTGYGGGYSGSSDMGNTQGAAGFTAGAPGGGFDVGAGSFSGGGAVGGFGGSDGAGDGAGAGAGDSSGSSSGNDSGSDGASGGVG